MTIETIYLGTRPSSTPGAVRVFDATGAPFDFDDDSFKTDLASATTPYLADTERASMGGSGKSAYTVALDLAKINKTGTRGAYFVRHYDGATPADADEPIDGGPLALQIAYGFPVDAQAPKLHTEYNLTTTAGQILAVMAFIEIGGEVVPIADLDAAATMAVTFREHGAGSDHLVLPAVTVNSSHRFETTYDTGSTQTPVFEDDRAYAATLTVTANGAARTWTNTLTSLG